MYLPIEKLYLILITNKNSNILEQTILFLLLSLQERFTTFENETIKYETIKYETTQYEMERNIILSQINSFFIYNM